MTIDGGFRARVLAREFLTGFWLNLGSTITAEMAGLAGYDWVLLDHEHGPGSETTIIQQLQAVAATPTTCLVRIAANEAARFKRVLDAGAAGVMVPYVSTPDEARAAVSAMRYPPRGMRGVAKLTRASSFGARFVRRADVRHHDSRSARVEHTLEARRLVGRDAHETGRRRRRDGL